MTEISYFYSVAWKSKQFACAVPIIKSPQRGYFSWAATGVIFPYGNGTVFTSHVAKGSLRYVQTLRFPDVSEAVHSLSLPEYKKLPKEFPVFWAATGNRTRIESSTSSSNNRYTIAAIFAECSNTSRGHSYTYFYGKSRAWYNMTL